MRSDVSLNSEDKLCDAYLQAPTNNLQTVSSNLATPAYDTFYWSVPLLVVTKRYEES